MILMYKLKVKAESDNTKQPKSKFEASALALNI